MAKILFEDKEALRDSQLPEKNKLTADNVNEIKSSVNWLYDNQSEQVNSDWNATTGKAEILNKPTIPTLTSDLTNDSGFITSSDLLTIVELTRSDLLTLITNNDLITGTYYQVTDRYNIIFLALETNIVKSIYIKRRLVQDQYYNDLTGDKKGVLKPNTSYSEGDIIVWGGRVWLKASGGSQTSSSDYNSAVWDNPNTGMGVTGFTLQNENDDIYYFTAYLECDYDIHSEQNITIRDWKNNTIFNDFNHEEAIYSDYGNNNIYNNSNSSCILNNSNNGDISGNSNDSYILNNSNNGFIRGNSNNGDISGNSNDSYIYNNSNNGYIRNNSNNGYIRGNSNNGDISINSNNGDISINSNRSYIRNNSNDGYIRDNSNNGFIRGNSSSVGIVTNNIESNQNNGNIQVTFTVDNVHVRYNQNNGNITGSIAATVEDTIVNK